MSYKHILLNIESGVAFLKLNRPEVLNSFNREMALELQEVLRMAESESKIRAVWISGEGRSFSAGQDLQEAIDPSGPSIATIVTEQYNPIVKQIRNLEKPVICAVTGVAAGAGANIAFACDITYAGRSANFIQSFSKIGLIPDSGGTYNLPRLAGMQRATALAFLANKINAEEAEKYGLIYKVIDDENVIEESRQVALQLAAGPTKAYGLTKRLMNRSFENTLEQQLLMEADIQAEAGASEDFKEGVEAFLEKRKPVYRGL